MHLPQCSGLPPSPSRTHTAQVDPTSNRASQGRSPPTPGATGKRTSQDILGKPVAQRVWYGGEGEGSTSAPHTCIATPPRARRTPPTPGMQDKGCAQTIREAPGGHDTGPPARRGHQPPVGIQLVNILVGFGGKAPVGESDPGKTCSITRPQQATSRAITAPAPWDAPPPRFHKSRAPTHDRASQGSTEGESEVMENF